MDTQRCEYTKRHWLNRTQVDYKANEMYIHTTHKHKGGQWKGEAAGVGVEGGGGRRDDFTKF